MSASIRDFVMNHPLFSHHDHHCHFKAFEEGRPNYDFTSLLGYAHADLLTAAGPRPAALPDAAAQITAYWPTIRTTGYGRAVSLGCEKLFGLEYAPENFPAITRALKEAIEGKSALQVYDYFVREQANNKWLLQDGFFRCGQEHLLDQEMYPDYYRFAWRLDDLFAIVDANPIHQLESATGIDILSLDHLVEAMNASIDRFGQSGKLAALKVGVAYQRDLVFGDPARSEAERAFSRIRSRKTLYEGIQHNAGAVNASEARPLADYMFHRLLHRANDENLPVQIHTGYLAGNWGALGGTRAMHLVPIFEKYRRVAFDIFHASWPWTSELGTIAKNYPNVYPDLCWMWTMNPAETERALGEWLDGVPFNKIFGYGADTGLPWCNAGYATQARIGIARVLEQKIDAGYFSPATAEKVAAAIMLRNGEAFYGLE